MLWNTYCYYQLENKFINYIVLLIITEIEKKILLMQKSNILQLEITKILKKI